ncbi:uncharacterized protein LOC110079826 [Pogona vitticeps]
MASSEEPGPFVTKGAEGSREKAMAVRSALLRRDSPGAEGCLPRRHHRPHQVRFKDLVDGSSGEEPPLPAQTPCASRPLERGAANPARCSWPQAKPCLLPLPSWPQRGASTAIQTWPGLQQPLEGCPLPSQAPWASAHEPLGRSPGGLGQDLPPWGSSTSLSAHSLCPASSQAHRGPSPPAALCPALPPAPPPGPGQSYLGRVPCLPAGWDPPSQQTPRVASPQLPPSPPRKGISVSPETLRPRPPALLPPPLPPGAAVGGRPSPHLLAQGSPRKETGLGPPPQLTDRDPSVPGGSVGTTASPQSLQAEAAAALWRGQAPCPPGEKSLPPPGYPLLVRPTLSRACLTPKRAASPQQVQDLLPLVAVEQAQRPGTQKAMERLPPTDQERPRETGDLQSRLHSLEGVLETSQEAIKVLLDVIQDLEKKEAQRDGRQSYRTGQDILNCGRCRECACVIYSVEHDFRQQEGRFRQVLSTIEVQPGRTPPTEGQATTQSHHKLPPAPRLPVRAEPKKSRRKCFFWFL